ncbi:MAG: hypothetical protein J5819_09155 [Eubacterium sp.]|nr:hypothetical protein [Eubacterium sp.]
MTLEEYMRELLLMRKQYGQEEELYPLINILLRENDNVKHLSVRHVADAPGKPGVNKGKIVGANTYLLYGYASMPDLVIFDENCDLLIGGEPQKDIILKQIDNMYGCVEAKIVASSHPVDDIKGENESVKPEECNSALGQLIGELLWYGRVLYTNGLVWKYLELKSVEYKRNDELITVDDKRKNGVDAQKRFLLNELLDVNEYNNESRNFSFEEWSKNFYWINSVKECTILSVEIGNLSDIYNTYINSFLKSEIPLKEILKEIASKDDLIKGWNGLKTNLACIDWTGTNTYDQFTHAGKEPLNELPK